MVWRHIQCAATGVYCALHSTVMRAAEESPTPGPDGDAFSHLVELTVGLIIVVVAIVAVGWVLKRVNRFTATAGGAVRIVGGLSMGPRERLVLVQVGKEQLLLGVAPGRVQTLHVLEEPIETQGEAPGSGPFAERLKTAMRRGSSQ